MADVRACLFFGLGDMHDTAQTPIGAIDGLPVLCGDLLSDLPVLG